MWSQNQHHQRDLTKSQHNSVASQNFKCILQKGVVNSFFQRGRHSNLWEANDKQRKKIKRFL